mgnify:CR=1 FL=1
MIKLIKGTIVLIIILAVQFNVLAQDEEITDEDLTAYATLLLKVDSMKVAAKAKFSEMVKSNELMNGGKRYNELKKAIGDEEKLSEIKATEEEIQAYNDLVASNTEASANIKAAFGAEVKEGIGARKYNIIKKMLKSDAEAKTKYDEIFASLKEKQEENTEEDTNE